MDVSIIIVNYNTLDLTRKCIESVINQSKDFSYEIILVDNASSDGSKSFFEKCDSIKYIYSTKNLGFGLGNNLGIDLATGKYLLFLNSDTLLLNNAIKILYDFMEDNETVGVCGGNLFDSNMEPTISFERNRPSLISVLNDLFGSRIYKLLYGKNLTFNFTDRPISVGYVSGADMMVRKKIINQVGGFSKDFFMYYEETELTDRINKLGYSIYSVPFAKVQHLEGKSFGKDVVLFNEKKETIKLESFMVYLKKCHPKYIQFLVVKLQKLFYIKQIQKWKFKHNVNLSQMWLNRLKILNSLDS